MNDNLFRNNLMKVKVLVEQAAYRTPDRAEQQDLGMKAHIQLVDLSNQLQYLSEGADKEWIKQEMNRLAVIMKKRVFNFDD